MNILYEATEQLYKAKGFLFILSVFNTIISLFSVYAFVLTGIYFLSITSALVFIFNVSFVWISIKRWRETRPVVIEAKQL
jgi:hypothetical protein